MPELALDNTEASETSRDETKRQARAALDAAMRRNPTLTRSGLAERLGYTNSNVSKILNNDDSHPLTMRFAKSLAEYIGSSLDDIFGPHSYFSILEEGETARDDSEAPPEIFNESFAQLVQYYMQFDFQPKRRRLNELAELIATSMHQSQGLSKDYRSEITKVLALEAGRAQ